MFLKEYKYHGLGLLLGSAFVLSGLSINPQPEVELNSAKRYDFIEVDVTNQTRFESNEMTCLARNIYFEARGEPTVGKLAVAHVTLNRVASNRFPNTVCDVVHQARYKPSWKTGKPVPIKNQCHFSWYCDGKRDTIVDIRAWREAKSIAYQALTDQTEDPTHGSTHYFNPTIADPEWKDHYTYVGNVGNHVFYR